MPGAADMAELKDAFNCFDKDAGGTISFDELGTVLDQFGHHMDKADLKKIVAKFDTDGDGVIDFEEFQHMMEAGTVGDVDEMAEAFKVFDKDGDGNITATEIRAVLNALAIPVTDAEIELMVKSVDIDGDGEISIVEFRKMMTDGPPLRPTVSE
mmetsp:Transcript_20031/g.17708  ORF Transcript_20031/g.17708 Transcript_20031/m.17708 type:complete len:154 (-) Transcript_20031:20-481(-)